MNVTAKQLLGEYKKLEKEGVIERVMDKIQVNNEERKVIKRPYNPTQKTLQKLTTVNDELQEYIANFSPYQYKIITVQKNLDSMFNVFFPPGCKKTNDMLEETKSKVIDHAIQGLMLTVRKYRQHLLPKGVFYEEDYYRQRMAYLMNNGKEAVMKSEDEYLLLESEIKKLMKSALMLYFKVQHHGLKYVGTFGLDKGICNDLMMDFQMECLKHFNDVSASTVSEIKRHIYKLLNRNEIEDLIVNYPKFKIKPLAIKSGNEKDGSRVLYESDVVDLNTIAWHYSKVNKFIGDSEKLDLFSSFLTAVEYVDSGKISKIDWVGAIVKVLPAMARNIEATDNNIKGC